MQLTIDNSPSSIDNERVKKYLLTGTPIFLAIILSAERLFFPERTLTATGGRALLDAFFALGLLALVLSVAAGTGYRLLRRFSLPLSPSEMTVFGVPLGLGIVAYGVLALGLFGWLNAAALAGWLVALMAFSWREWTRMAANLSLRAGWQRWRRWHIGYKVVFGATTVIFGLSALQALTPPWNYDGLMYHLQAPRLFLQAGRIAFQPENWPANYPLTTEMLYTLGMAFGSDTFARLMHLTLAAWLVLATFVTGRHFLGKSGGWLAATILLGIPMYPIWGSLSNVDMGWSLWGFLALFAMLRWQKSDNRRWLALAGVLAGLAIGSKYLALGLMFPVGMWILWHARRGGWKTMLVNGVIFGGVALAVASPWYLKNWLWTGNPVYPLLWGGPGWDLSRLAWLEQYQNSFGAGRKWLDYLLLPIRLYTQYGKFSGFLGNTEIPSFLFPLLIFYPVTRKSPALNGMVFIVIGQFIFWTIGPQHTRFLLPLFPTLSILTAYVMLNLSQRFSRPSLGRIAITSLVGGTIAATLIYALIWFVSMQPLAVISGTISKADFLTENVSQFNAVQFIQENLSPSEKTLLIWDSRGYYCDSRCVPDIEQSMWTQMVARTPNVAGVLKQLQAQGISHLAVSWSDIEFLSHHDPTGLYNRALNFLLDDFVPACARKIYEDDAMYIFEITCQ